MRRHLASLVIRDMARSKWLLALLVLFCLSRASSRWMLHRCWSFAVPSSPAPARRSRPLATIVSTLLCWNPSLDTSHPIYALQEGALCTLRQLSKTFCVHVVHDTRGSTLDQLEFRHLAQQAGLSVSCVAHTDGICAVIRRLEPSVHVDVSLDRIRRLAAIVPHLYWVPPKRLCEPASSSSLASLPPNVSVLHQSSVLNNVVACLTPLGKMWP